MMQPPPFPSDHDALRLQATPQQRARGGTCGGRGLLLQRQHGREHLQYNYISV
jgi:hypothetical protein